ncbi:TNA1 is necessary for nicotinic acid import into the cell [Seiridium cupressi]
MYIIPMSTTNVGARYFSMMILPFASVGPQLLLYKTINLHLARPISKSAAASALVNAIGGTSNIWASYLYCVPPQFFCGFWHANGLRRLVHGYHLILPLAGAGREQALGLRRAE